MGLELILVLLDLSISTNKISMRNAVSITICLLQERQVVL